MSTTPPRPDSKMREQLRRLGLLGIAIMIIGAGFDLLPGSRPGFHSLQILVIIFGLLLALVAFVAGRGQAIGWTASSLAKVLAVSLITLLALELILVAAGRPTYFPLQVPKSFLQPAPWWTCDDSGCHHVPAAMDTACASGQVSGRRCIVNQQGFHDTQDFTFDAGYEDNTRILILGDSFTFGMTAEIGKSYVETIESSLPQAVVWNTGIPFLGTNQALLSFKKHAPILMPQLTIYGFYINDFDDNLTPVDGYFVGVDENNETFAIQQYHVDPWGTVTKLEDQYMLYYRFHGVEAPANEFERLIGSTRLGSLFINSIDYAGKLLGVAQGALFNRKIELTRGYLRELRDASAARETTLLVLLIPSVRDLEQPGIHFTTAMRLFEELGIPYLNPLAALEPERDYWIDGHWNTAGHQRIGALLSECVEAFMASGKLSDCQNVVMP